MYTWMAKPQTNGADTDVLQQLDLTRFGWKKHPATTPVTLCDGAIDVYSGKSPHYKSSLGMGDTLRPALSEELSDAWAAAIRPYIQTWSAGHDALARYLDEVWLWQSIEAKHGGRGCASGHVNTYQQPTYPYHAVYVSMYDLQGTAQGIYHEYAHLRLETLGVQIETHDYALLLNDPTELYHSSVRFDVKRPMSAVLHGVYAWLMFTENDWQLYEHHVIDQPTFSMYTKHNIPKIRNGIREIQEYGRFTNAGTEFITGVYLWADDLCRRCEEAYT